MSAKPSYIVLESGNVAVYLKNVRVGTIQACRWRYVPAGKSTGHGGELYDSIAEVKASLEES